MKNVILLLIFNFIFLISFCQTPQLINYQGVARDSAGHPLLNQNISLRLSILDSTNNGPIIFIETHSVQTNGSGLFNINIGGGVNSLGVFSSIPWGKGNKWLKVDMDVNGGSNYLLIGKTQFLSVPYSFYSQSAEDLTNIRVSVTGDTLFFSKTKWVKIPNISTANFSDGNACTNDTVDQAGNIVHIVINTDDNNACTADGCHSTTGVFHNPANINDNNNCTVDACDPASGAVTHVSIVNDVDGNSYNIIPIGGQCWFSKNLNTAHYRNGDAITTGLTGIQWANTSSGAYGTNGPEAVYGKLYNNYAIMDVRQVCPVGYHIPSLTEWSTLINGLGGFSSAGGPLKEAGILHWNAPNTGATNSSGFTALPNGSKNYSDGIPFEFGNACYFWTSNAGSTPPLIGLGNTSVTVDQYSTFRNGGLSVRCLKD